MSDARDRTDGEGGKLDGAARGRNRDGRNGTAAALTTTDEHRRGADPVLQVRASDIEPYTGLGYLSKLFRVIAVLLLVLLVVELIAGVTSEDPDKWQTLLGEASRLVVVAGVLWGAGDFATLLIDVGHDVRAVRVLLGRQALHPDGTAHDGQAHDAMALGAPERASRSVVAGDRADGPGPSLLADVPRGSAGP